MDILLYIAVLYAMFKMALPYFIGFAIIAFVLWLLLVILAAWFS